MRNLRFKGVMNDIQVDITLTTDAISSDAECFNVIQVQVGAEFSPNDVNDDDYKNTLGAFKRINSTRGAMIQFAIDNALDLISTDKNGGDPVYLHDDASVSNSNSATN